MGGRCFAAGVSVALSLIAGAQASPWNRADGRVFASTQAAYYSSTIGITRYQRIDSETYLEFGLTPNWMIGGLASHGVSVSQSAAGTFTQTGLNEAQIYAQRQVQRGDRSATSLKISGVRSGRLSLDAQSGAPAPNFEVEIRALHGRNVVSKPFKIFTTLETGFRKRLGGDADQVRVDALIGVEPSPRLMILLEAQSIASLGNEEPGFADYDLVRAQASVLLRWKPRWSFVAGGRKEISTRNVVPGAAVYFGVWSQF